MLVPSTEHPSSISAWIKFHKLPLECWIEVGLSHIASTVGKPIHVDKATHKKQRLDYARICIELEVGNDLPTEVVIKSNGELVVVEMEHQWLPSQCTKCKVFRHTMKSCGQKSVSKPSTLGNNWHRVGKEKDTSIDGSSIDPKLSSDATYINIEGYLLLRQSQNLSLLLLTLLSRVHSRKSTIRMMMISAEQWMRLLK